MTEKEARKEVDRVLKEQGEKGILRWQISLTLISKGFSERQSGILMGCNAKTIHASKIDFSNGKARRPVKTYLRLDIIKIQRFWKAAKIIAGEPGERGRVKQ